MMPAKPSDQPLNQACIPTEILGIDPKYSVHSLRHSIATHLLDAGEGIEFVRDHLGHTNIQNTMIYAQITNHKREEIFKRLETNIAKI